MADLRDLLGGRGGTLGPTVLQSGNPVFRTTRAALGAVEGAFETALAGHHGLETGVLNNT